MKKAIFLFVISWFNLMIFAQDKAQLLQQIENAKSFEEMPVIKITANRDHNYKVRKEGFNEVANIKKGDVFTLYFPVYIEKNNTWKTVWYSYNYICLEPSMSTNSKIVTRVIDLDISKEDRQLYHKWLFQYENLGRIKLKEQDEL